VFEHDETIDLYLEQLPRALYQRAIKNTSALVQVSMFESILDFQFEVLTCFYNDGNELPVRSSVSP